MRRALIATGLLVAAGALLAGCGSEGVVAPLPNTVQGTLPQPTTPTTPTAKGNPARGKALFTSQGCGGCHRFTPAGTTGTIGPNLDHLVADAKKANQGSLLAYTETSIKDPSAYVVPGYPNGVMPSTYGTSLTAQQIADLVAFLTQKS
jgi:mono/diheme cytochrome c family protein